MKDTMQTRDRGSWKSGQRSRGIRLAHGVHHRYDSGANHQFVPKLDRATRRMSAIEAAAVTEHAHHQDDHVVVAMEHLEKSFGDNHVLRGIDLVLKKGENLVLLGKSGTGKSVLIKCVVGLVDCDEGNLFLFGQNVADLDEKKLMDIRKKIGFLFQSSALYDSMTVRENLEFPLNRQQQPIPKRRDGVAGTRGIAECRPCRSN